jgi:hypothetical protein
MATRLRPPGTAARPEAASVDAARAMEEPTADPNEPEADPPAPERRDAEGIPLDRAPTIDDVRGGAEHFKIAVGCSTVVVLLVAAFWLLRVLLAR